MFILAQASQAQQLKVAPRVQEKLNWDWNAICQMALDAYGYYYSQTAIAAYATPTTSPTTSTGVALSTDAAGRISVKTTLLALGNVASTPVASALSLADLTTHIKAGHAVIAQSSQGIFLIYGVNGSIIYYVCPWPGFGQIGDFYTTFQQGGGAPWTNSLILTTPIPLMGTAPVVNRPRPIPEKNVPRNFAVYAFDRAWINDLVKCYANSTTTTSFCEVGSGWQSSLTNLSNTYGLTLGADAQIGNVKSSGPVWMRDRSKINGSLTMSNTSQLTRQNQTTVTGAIAQSTVPYQGFGWGTIDLTGIAKTTVNIEPDQPRRTLAPGKYWTYNIKARSPVRLSAGDYYFNTLNCDACTMEIDASAGPVRIYVAWSVLWSGKLSYPIAFTPEKVFFSYVGTSPVYINGSLDATVLVPSADLIIGQTVKTFTGMYIGRTVTVHQQSVVRFKPFAYFTN